MRLQYEFTNRNEQVKTITFKNTVSIDNIENIIFFKEEASGDFISKEFRYSFDDIVWNEWTTLTQPNISKIIFADQPQFYLEVKYERFGILSGDAARFWLYYIGNISYPYSGPPDASIDADYLGGQPPEYYLDVNNFFGGNIELYQSYNIDGSGVGTYYNTVDSSNARIFYFKRIKDSSTVFISETPAGEISLDASVETSPGAYDSSLAPTIEMVDPLGGYPAGTTVADLEGKTFSSMWDDLLFPTVDPDFINPSSTFVDNVGTLFETNDILSINYTSTFNRGSISIGATFQDYRSGLPHSYYYSDPSGNSLIPDVSSSALTNTPSISNYIIQTGSNTFSNYIGYTEGPQPLDSKGNPYSTPLPAGNTSTDNLTIIGVYPIFATTSNITTLTKQALIPMYSTASHGYTVVPETGGDKQKIDIPDKWTGVPTNNPLTGIQTYNTIASIWEYQGGSAAASLTIWTTSSVTQTIQGIVENYTRYTYNGADRSSIEIRLIF